GPGAPLVGLRRFCARPWARRGRAAMAVRAPPCCHRRRLARDPRPHISEQRRALRCGAVLLWSLSLMPQEGWATSDQEQVSSEVNEDVQDCDEELNKSDPFHSCLCKRWEKTFK
ncbi:unnamed protein product, partial [Prorocentrum cordatum]